MRKWAQQIEMQRRKYRTRSGTARTSDSSRSTGPGTSATEFDYMRNIGGQLENPYAQDYQEDEDDDAETQVPSGQHSYTNSFNNQQYPGMGDFPASRNGSQTSLRSRSTTGESGMTPVPQTNGRAAPPRFQPGSIQQQPQLALRTRELAQQAQSPGDMGPVDSYFSPMEGSPNNLPSSARTSASSGMYPFPRQQIPQTGYYEEGQGHGTRFTAPAIARQRELSGGAPPAGRSAPPQAQRPGMSMHSSQQMPGPPRNRSASSPDIHNNQRGMRGSNGGPTPPPQPPVPEMPLSYQQNPHMIPRSQSNSPSLNGMVNSQHPPARGMSPHMQRERGYPPQRMAQDPSPTSYNGRGPFINGGRMMTPLQERDGAFSPPPSFQQQSTAPAALQSPPMHQTSFTDAPPTQLKVRVHCDAANQVLTLVVPLSITYQSLKDRIDAKLQRSTTVTLSDKGPTREGQTAVKLKFLDDNDFVSILSDDDVQTAFENWREQNDAGGGMGEVDLYCR